MNYKIHADHFKVKIILTVTINGYSEVEISSYYIVSNYAAPFKVDKNWYSTTNIMIIETQGFLNDINSFIRMFG